jgi:anti-sigma regulatory factor (Ser/Thr protein kinase)
MEAAVKLPNSSSQLHYVIDDGSKVGEARRAAQTLASFEFSAEVAGKVAIATTELASNLLNHAGSGWLLMQVLGGEDETLIELIALDRGPGMQDVARCMTDGYSTSGTPGTGLGAVRRLADDFDMFSAPGEGTIVMARFGATPALRYGAISLAMHGEVDCGDAWQLVKDADGIAVFVVDGLGHGTFAAEAAQTGIDAFLQSPADTPMEILQRANRLMSKTRGGAAACARVIGTRLTYAGVGNISGYLVAPGRSQGLMSHNGTLGMHQRHTKQLDYHCDPGSLLVMHSDGLSARWDIKNHPTLLHAHPAIVAAALYRDHVRGRDDATVMVVAL